MIKNIHKFICKSFVEENNIIQQSKRELEVSLKSTEDLLSNKIEDNLELQKENAELEESQMLPVDKFCKDKYQKVTKFYNDKLNLKGEELLPCDLREIFSPNSYLVQKFKSNITKNEDTLTWFKNIRREIHNKIVYRTESYDNYYLPQVTIQMSSGDCDDMAFLQMSIEPELGVAFGFIKQNSKWIGHAFSVGIYQGNLFVFDAVNNYTSQLPDDMYKIYYIVTSSQVYEVDRSIEFGEVLWK